MPRVSVGQAELATKPHALYRFYDATDVLLYVGITADLPSRISTHRTEKPWWTLVAHIRVEQFGTRAEALAAEAQAIRAEKPIYNVAGNATVALGQSPAEAVAEFADTILRRATECHEAYEQALENAREDIASAELDGDTSNTNPLVHAAEIAVSDASNAQFFYSRALGHVIDWLPPDLYARCRKAAEAYEAQWDFPVTEAELARRTFWFVALERCQQYLQAMSDEERDEWLTIAQIANPRIAEPNLTFEAAHHARAWKAGTWHYFMATMCSFPGDHDASCRERATVRTWYVGDPACRDLPACLGHVEMCLSHHEAVSDGGWFWARDDTPIVVERSDLNPAPRDSTAQF